MEEEELNRKVSRPFWLHHEYRVKPGDPEWNYVPSTMEEGWPVRSKVKSDDRRKSLVVVIYELIPAHAAIASGCFDKQCLAPWTWLGIRSAATARQGRPCFPMLSSSCSRRTDEGLNSKKIKLCPAAVVSSADFMLSSTPLPREHLVQTMSEPELRVVNEPAPASDSLPTRDSLLNRMKDLGDNASWGEFFETYWEL